MSTSGSATVINDRYEIHKRIGRGGMADVFLAQDLLLDRQVAIKVLFPEFAVDPNFVERFRREAQAAANLSHPNIVNVFDWGKYEGTYFIAMEYVHGRTLAEILKTNDRLTPKQAAEIASEVAAALGFAHQADLAHRDIKPGNILIGANGQVKVADFGIARAMNAGTEANLTQAGSVMGTAAYFSPEQAQGAQPDPRSDLYSLGIVMYEMVAGRPPFQGENAVSIAYKQVHDQPTPINQLVDGVPRPFEAIVAKLLAKDPKLRYPSANALRDDLRRFRNGEQVQALVAAAARPSTSSTAVGAAVVGTSTDVMPSRPVDTTPDIDQRRGPTEPAIPGAPTTVLARGGHADLTEYPPGASPEARYYQDNNSRTGWYALAAFITLIALAAGGVLLFQRLSDQTVDDPGRVLDDYRGQTFEQAAAALEALGHVPLAVPIPDATQSEGIVYETRPEAGQVVPIGGEVQLIYNPPQASVHVPDVSGRDLELAIQILTADGFEVDPEHQTESSDIFRQGVVIRTDPPSGEPVPLTQVIKLFVSGGPDDVFVPPNIINMTLEEARLRLEALSLVVDAEFVEDSVNEPGRVVRSEPAPNEPVQPGSTIVLFVSAGPGDVTVPPLLGVTEAQARNTLRDLDLQIDATYRGLEPGDPNDGLILEQSPVEGRTVERGSTVSVVIGRATEADTTTTQPTLPPATTAPPATTTPATTTPPTEPSTTTTPPTSDAIIEVQE